MTMPKFLILFLVTVIVSIILLYGLSTNERFGDYVDVGYYAIPAFSILSLSIYFITEMLERRDDKQALLNIVIINVMSKFVLTAAVIALYYKNTDPEDGIFVVPFILVYIVFTIFETYFMSEQAKTK